MSPSSSSSSSSSKKKTKKPKLIRLMVKCSWNGRRIPLGDVSISTTLHDICQQLQNELPQQFWEGEATILYLRKSVGRSLWDRTTLDGMGVCGEGGSALLTLNLPSGTPSAASAPAPTTEANATSSETKPKPTPSRKEEALNLLLSSTFDSSSLECITTLLKLLDNILLKPDEPKVRTIRIANPNFHAKVASKPGGIDFLLACGFAPQTELLGGSNPTHLELLPPNESKMELIAARSLLQQTALKLGATKEDLPPLPSPAPITNTATSQNKNDAGFDLYKGHKFNTQALAHGANPTQTSLDGSTYVSSTERQLQTLTQKAQKLEEKFTSQPLDRCIIAYRPRETVPSFDIQEKPDKADGALLATRFQKMAEERKKREDGGFTTKAMRDLEKMKQSKVYSHAQLRINFPDGYILSSKFYPKETISDVKRIIQSCLIQQQSFDLYVAPPKRMLQDQNTLSQEGLVPASKVFVSWVGGAGSGEWIKQELFGTKEVEQFPDGKNVVMEKKEESAKKMSEEEMMMRMMGKGGGGLKGSSKGGSSKGDDKKKLIGKPKWFK